MKKHKFKGRELLECLKRMSLKTVHAGELLTEDGKDLDDFSIIIDGQCSRHMSMLSSLGKAFRAKILKSTTRKVLDDDYPGYFDRKIRRLDSMDFSQEAMISDIQSAI